jgi:hypothetical protein
MNLLFNPAVHTAIYSSHSHGHSGPWSETDTNIAITILLVNLILAAIIGIWSYFTPDSWSDPKPSDFVFNPIEIGALYSVCYGFLLCQGVTWFGVGIYHLIF